MFLSENFDIVVSYSSGCGKAKQKMYPVSGYRPTLTFCPDSKIFIDNKNKKIISDPNF